MKTLISIIENEFNKETTSSYKAKPKFNPSSLGSPCLRKIFYSYLRVEKDIKPPLQLKKYAAKGNLAHELISQKLREANVLVDYKDKDGNTPKNFFNPEEDDHEFPLFDKDLEMVLKIDGVMIIDGELWLGEWKTATVNSFGKLTQPKPPHLVQGSTYIYLFNKALKDGVYSHIPELNGFTEVKGLKFLYMNMDDLSMKEWTLIDPIDIFTNTVNKIVTVKNHCNNNTLPPTTQDWCISCEWKNKCLQNFKPVIE